MAELIPVENLDVVKAIVAEHREVPGCLMQILQETQEKYGYLPLALQGTIADELGIPLTEVYGVATFYSQFTLTPKGKFKIGICLGTACYVRGAEKVLDELKKTLKVKVGETTPDGKFSLSCLRCVGACGLSPVVMVGEKTYGRVSPDGIKDILKEYE